ncbi:MAG: hypothetical protein IKA71_04680, partial [Lentisphaeria bacterium]|nr:hypothetical protein [Lentisphaeria bacterium]
MAITINENPATWDDILAGEVVKGDKITISKDENAEHGEIISSDEVREASLTGGIIYDISGATFSGNTATVAGGALNISSNGNEISGTLFHNNASSQKGAAISLVSAALNISGCTFTGNTSTYSNSEGGGAIYIDLSNTSHVINISNTTFSDNHSQKNGGVIYYHSTAGQVNLTNALVVDNSSIDSGAIRNLRGTMTLSGVTFANNSCYSNVNGSALRNGGQMTFAGEIILGANQTVYNTGTITIDAEKFITGDALQIAKVVDAEGEWYYDNNGTGVLTSSDDSLLLHTFNNDLFITNADADTTFNTVDYIVTAEGTVTTAVDQKNNTIYLAANATSDPSVATGKTNSVISGTLSVNSATTVKGTRNITGISNATLIATSETAEYAAFQSSSEGCVFSVSNISFTGFKKAITNARTMTVTGCTFNNNATALASSSKTIVSDCMFVGNTYSYGNGGGSMYVEGGTTTITGTTFSSNSSVSKRAGAIYLRDGNLIINNTLFYKNHGAGGDGAIYVYMGSLTLNGATFNGNYTDGSAVKGTVGIRSGQSLYLSGTVFLDKNQSIRNEGTTTVVGSSFFTADMQTATVLNVLSADNSFDDSFINTSGTLTVTDGKLYVAGNDLMVTNADAVVTDDETFVDALADTKVIYADLAAALADSGKTLLAKDYSSETALEITSAESIGANGNVTLDVPLTVTETGTVTLSGLIIAGDIANAGTVNLNGTNTITGNITGDGVVAVDNAEINFNNSGAVNLSGLTFSGDTNSLIFNGAQVNFATGQDLSDVAITVDGARFDGQAVTIAANVTNIGSYTINNDENNELKLVLNGTDLVLKAKATIADGAVIDTNFINKGSESLITGGEIKAVFVGTDLTSGNVDTEVQGGKFNKFFVGGALVKTEAADMGTVTVSVSGGEFADRIYGAGYAYGIGDVDADTVATELHVAKSEVVLSGGTVNDGVFGGAHARKNAHVLVDAVNINISGGTFKDIFGGGWAERSSTSTVTSATIDMSAGFAKYIFAGGANSS